MTQIKTSFGSVYPVSNKIFDVFWGDGWDNCIRVIKKNNKLDVLKFYKKPPQHLLEQATEIICKGKN